MKSLTIHNIENPLLSLLRDRARKEGKSINSMVKESLEKMVGMKVSGRNDHKKEFEDLFGVWSEKDLAEFEKATADFGKISVEEWR